MKLNRILQIMRTEYLCVRRNDDGYCKRKCEKCDLLLPTDEVITAYMEVIAALEYLVDKEDKERTDRAIDFLKNNPLKTPDRKENL